MREDILECFFEWKEKKRAKRFLAISFVKKYVLIDFESKYRNCFAKSIKF